jgi:hypothetical protein
MQLRIVEDIIQFIGIIHGLCRVIARHDPDLSKQMKRAINSLGLNAGEGLSARGGNRTVRLESAMVRHRCVVHSSDPVIERVASYPRMAASALARARRESPAAKRLGAYSHLLMSIWEYTPIYAGRAVPSLCGRRGLGE